MQCENRTEIKDERKKKSFIAAKQQQFPHKLSECRGIRIDRKTINENQEEYIFFGYRCE